MPKIADILWDSWCILSVVGIWPRYIEPKILKTNKFTIKCSVEGNLKIAAFSDLHFNPSLSDKFLAKITSQVMKFKPDLIFFLGDFLCDGHLYQKERLEKFLNTFSAPLGCFAVLGNHDYAEPVSINEHGEYDITERESHFSKAFTRIFNNIELKAISTERALNVKDHDELIDLLYSTPFKLLNNHSEVVGDSVNIVGLGEYSLGKAHPKIAFKHYCENLPGIVLVHNPDMIPRLEEFPGQIILCGHTHGGQINLPWIWKKLTVMEHLKYKEGLIEENGKTLYITRGVGSVKQFRWNAPPELCLITLEP